MALSGEMIQFRRLNLGNNATESRPKMLDARSQQIASAPHNSVHRVPLFQKQFAQVGAVLTGDPGNQRDFVGILHLCQIFVRN